MTDVATGIKAKYDRLHELIEKTAKNRFLASARMTAHKHWSSWTVTLMTISVLGLSLIQSMDIGHASADKGITFAIVMLSTFILVYSITMSMSEFALQSHQYHQCGLDLMKLRGEVFNEKMQDGQMEDKYTSLNDKYGAILDRYENHSPIDYIRMQISSKTMKEYYRIRWYGTLCIHLRYFSTFWHYLVLIFASMSYLGYVSWRFFTQSQ